MPLAYLNGEFLELKNAKVSVLDRGFLFGDSLYEVIPSYQGKTFGLTEHLNRLDDGLAQIQLQLHKTRAELETIIQEIITKNEKPFQAVYLQVTRGAGEKRDHALPAEYQPTLFITSFEFTPKSLKEMNKGISAYSVQDSRWQHCDIKATTLLANILCLQEAKEQKADEAILIRDDYAVEGVASNLFIVKNKKIKTAPLSNILNGVTRRVVMDLAKANNFKIEESPISVKELKKADEIWLTGSIREIIPVLTLDGKKIGTGEAGPVWHQLITEYRKLILPSETLMTFPCSHTIKIMGKATDDFEKSVLFLVNQHADIPENGLDFRLSKDNNYLSLSVTVLIENKQQLDLLYHALSANPKVLMAL